MQLILPFIEMMTNFATLVYDSQKDFLNELDFPKDSQFHK